VAESIARGYLTFFQEMTRTARRVTDVYRSDSGILVRKPRPQAATGASPSSPGESVSEDPTSLPDGTPRDAEAEGDLAQELSHLAARFFAILRRGAPGGP